MTVQAESVDTDFETLFQNHWSGVYSVIYRIVGDHAEAEDLALETFLKLHRRPPRDRKNLSGWLYRVATNLGLNALRASKRRAHYENQAGTITHNQEFIRNPAAVLEQENERQHVRKTLTKMKKRSAKLLILRYSGFSYGELAETLGIRPSSVGTLLARAEKEFKRHFLD